MLKPVNVNKIFENCRLYLCSLTLILLCSCQTQPIHQPDAQFKIALILPKDQFSEQYLACFKAGWRKNHQLATKISAYKITDNNATDLVIKKIKQQPVDLIVAPNSASLTQELAQQVTDLPIISLANKPSLAKANVFILGHIPMQRLKSSVQQHLKLGYLKYITVFPKDYRYPKQAKLLAHLIADQQGELVKNITYGDAGENIVQTAEIIADSVDRLNEDHLYLKQPVVILAGKPEPKLLQQLQQLHVDQKAILVSENFYVNQSPELKINYLLPIKQQTRVNILAQQLQQPQFNELHLLLYDAAILLRNYVGENYQQAEFLSRIKSQQSVEGLYGTTRFRDQIVQRAYQAN